MAMDNKQHIGKAYAGFGKTPEHTEDFTGISHYQVQAVVSHEDYGCTLFAGHRASIFASAPGW